MPARKKKPKPRRSQISTELDKSIWESPKWLSPDAKRTWERCAPALFVHKVLQPDHRIWFELFCSVYGNWQNAGDLATRATTREERQVYETVRAEYQELLEQLFDDIGFNSEIDFEEFLRKSVQ